MAQVVIIGGGTAGLPAAYELAELARPGERITVVADRDHFRPGASAPWITALDNTGFDLAQNLRRRGIGFTAAGARRLHPERNQLELGDGNVLDYDFIVIAAGPRPAFEEIQGLGPRGYTHSLCHGDHLAGCVRDWNRFVLDPGPVVVGAVQGATCFGPAYESAFLMERELRTRGLRGRVAMTFVTAEPYVGHLGVDGIGDSRARLEAALRERDIAWIAGARIERVERGVMHVTEVGSARTHLLRFRYSMMMPPFRGIEAVAGIEGLADARGFILIDEFLRNPKYPNVYAAGVTVASAGPDAARIAAEARKTAYVIQSMVSAVARNIRDGLDGKAPAASAEWNPVHLADLGASGLAFVADPAAATRPAHGVAAGDWVQMSRCSACDVAH
ncbi:MAG: NAD(P)/FAD-dependent oxidoreductase [Betaproteobacteria bacterium]|nr:MAG: NAD(P)/FAD-dependent oxidoreductase [Betaproteobacteria bacterium]